MASVVRNLDCYKSEHLILLKEATTLLELALWKANLDGKEGDLREGVRTTRGSRKIARKNYQCYVWCKHCDQECVTLSSFEIIDRWWIDDGEIDHQ